MIWKMLFVIATGNLFMGIEQSALKADPKHLAPSSSPGQYSVSSEEDCYKKNSQDARDFLEGRRATSKNVNMKFYTFENIPFRSDPFYTEYINVCLPTLTVTATLKDSLGTHLRANPFAYLTQIDGVFWLSMPRGPQDYLVADVTVEKTTWGAYFRPLKPGSNSLTTRIVKVEEELSRKRVESSGNNCSLYATFERPSGQGESRIVEFDDAVTVGEVRHSRSLMGFSPENPRSLYVASQSTWTTDRSQLTNVPKSCEVFSPVFDETYSWGVRSLPDSEPRKITQAPDDIIPIEDSYDQVRFISHFYSSNTFGAVSIFDPAIHSVYKDLIEGQ